MRETRKRLPRYKATFRFTSKKIDFLQTWSTTMVRISRTVVGVWTGRVPREGGGPVAEDGAAFPPKVL